MGRAPRGHRGTVWGRLRVIKLGHGHVGTLDLHVLQTLTAAPCAHGCSLISTADPVGRAVLGEGFTFTNVQLGPLGTAGTGASDRCRFHPNCKPAGFLSWLLAAHQPQMQGRRFYLHSALRYMFDGCKDLLYLVNKADNEKSVFSMRERENFPQTSMKTPFFFFPHKNQTLHKINFVKI